MTGTNFERTLNSNQSLNNNELSVILEYLLGDLDRESRISKSEPKSVSRPHSLELIRAFIERLEDIFPLRTVAEVKIRT